MKFDRAFLLIFFFSACTEVRFSNEHIFDPIDNTPDPISSISKPKIQYTYPSGNSFGFAVLQETWKGYCNEMENEYLKIARGLNYLTNDIEGLSFSDCIARMREVKNQLNDKTIFSAYVNTQEMFSSHPERVWQQSNYNWIIANATQYRLLNVKSEPLSVWGGMEMMNQLSSGVSVNGKTYREYINDRIISQLDKASGLFDSIQYDNFNYIMQWIYQGTAPAGNLSPWEYDRLNREGLRLMLLDMKAKRPDLGITIRSKSHKFSSVVDGVVFEDALSSDIDNGIFGALNQIALIAKYSKHCVVHNTVGTDEMQEEKVMTSIAVSWLFGCDASVDTLGDQDHFYTNFPILEKLHPGKPIGEIKGPKVVNYEENVNIEAGSCVTVKGVAGDVAVAWYDIYNGEFGFSGMHGLFSSTDKDDSSFFWDSGLRVEVMKEDNPKLCFDGLGSLSLNDFTIYRMTESSVFYRRFENLEIFINPFNNKDVDAVAKDGTVVRIKPAQGIVRKIG